MDPLTAVSLAGTVGQFIEFSIKVVKTSLDLYQGRQSTVNGQIEMTAQEIGKLSEKLASSLNEGLSAQAQLATPPSDNEVALQDVAKGCKELANELLNKLAQIQAKGKRRAWKSFKEAISNTWRPNEIAMIEHQLLGYRDIMNTRLLTRINEKIDHLVASFEGLLNDPSQHRCPPSTISGRRNSTADQPSLSLSDTASQEIRGLIAEALLHTSLPTSRSINNRVVDPSRRIRRRLNLQMNMQEESNATILSSLTKLIQNNDHAVSHAIRENISKNEAHLRALTTEQLVHSLRFDTITERIESIDDAHPETFQWIFQHTEDSNRSRSLRWSEFTKWLKTGNNLYWINGKAGSGKSTLMKYLQLNPMLRNYLNYWAEGKPLHIAFFYFWSAGAKMQKSKIGLLRSLLYDLLCQVMDLIPVCMPKRWEAQYSWNSKLTQLKPNDPWTLQELAATLKSLIQKTQGSRKLCWFIDGVDEFEGNDSEIASFLNDLVATTQVKICISSRPHLVFEKAFGTGPQMRLQDLTHRDIKRFVTNQLLRNEMMLPLRAMDEDGCTKLLDTIISAANGVFLWVRLVVNTLIRGLEEDATIDDLRLMLQEIPRDLEKLYMHKLLKVNKVFQPEASKIFQLVAAATAQPDDDEDISPLSIIGLDLALDPNLHIEIISKSHSESLRFVQQRCEAVEAKLKARTGGLIEINRGFSKSRALAPEMRISYFHRTVHDFLESEEARNLLFNNTSRIASDRFHPDLAILQGIIAQIRINQKIKVSNLNFLLFQGMIFLRRVNLLSEGCTVSLIEQLEHAAEVAGISLTAYAKLSEAIESGSNSYLKANLHDMACKCSAREKSALLETVLDLVVAEKSETSPMFITETLLSCGADPNLTSDGASVWEKGLYCMVYAFQYLKATLNEDRLDVWRQWMMILLDHGANPFLEVSLYHREEALPSKDRTKRRDCKSPWSISKIISELWVANHNTRAQLQSQLERSEAVFEQQTPHDRRSQEREQGSDPRKMFESYLRNYE